MTQAVADPRRDVTEQRRVGGQRRGVDLREAAADQQPVDGVGQAAVDERIERHHLGAGGDERVDRVGVQERERPPGGDRDAHRGPGAGQRRRSPTVSVGAERAIRMHAVEVAPGGDRRAESRRAWRRRASGSSATGTRPR